jgi:hypothetical protein
MTLPHRSSALCLALGACSGTISVGSLVCIGDGGDACVPTDSTRTLRPGNAANTLTLPVDAGDDTSGDCALSVTPARIDFAAYPLAESPGSGPIQITNLGTTCTIAVQVGPSYYNEYYIGVPGEAPQFTGPLNFVLPPGSIQQVDLTNPESDVFSTWSSIPISPCPSCPSAVVVLTHAIAFPFGDGGDDFCQGVQLSLQQGGGAVTTFATVGDSLALWVSPPGVFLPAWQPGLTAGPFSIYSPSLPYGLPVDSQQQLVLFQPVQAGEFTETLIDPITGCSMTATATAIGPDAGSACLLIADQGFLGFDSIPAGESRIKTLMLTNVGDQACEVWPSIGQGGFGPGAAVVPSSGAFDSFDLTIPDCTVDSPPCAINPDTGTISGPFEILPSSDWSLEITFNSRLSNEGEPSNFGWYSDSVLAIDSNDSLAHPRLIWLYATSE